MKYARYALTADSAFGQRRCVIRKSGDRITAVWNEVTSDLLDARTNKTTQGRFPFIKRMPPQKEALPCGPKVSLLGVKRISDQDRLH